MGESVKYIIEELNKPPYNKNFNLISFHEIDQISLLQLLTDVLGEIDPRLKIDIREEAADETAVRILNQLRVLKYKPHNDDMVAFRTGLVQSEKHIVYPIIEWLLVNTKELKQRAYLGRFLVRLDVPPDFRNEDQVSDLYQQYDELMDKFKLTHKQAMLIKNSGFNTGEIRKDISNMEEEKEQLLKRIERLKRKVDSNPNAQSMMSVSRNLRLERDKEQKLANQRQEQKNHIQHCEQRVSRLQQQLRDRRHAGVGATPHSLYQRLEEESRTNEYMVNDRLPKEIESRKKTVLDLQRVAMEPAMGQSDIDSLNTKVVALNAELNELIEKRMRSNDPIDDKLSLFKQQAAIIAHKKEAAAEGLREARDELAQTTQELDTKKGQLGGAEGGEVLKGDEFKSFVNKLRSKSTTYKKKRQEVAELRAEMGVLSRTDEIIRGRNDNLNSHLEVAELRAEMGVLSRTDEIIRGRNDNLNSHLNELEGKKGVSGYRVTQEELERVSAAKGTYDEQKGQTLENISEMVRKLTGKINSKRSAMAPIIKELRPLRERHQELKTLHEDRKAEYDRNSAGIESNRSKLEQEVRGLREEVSADETRHHTLHTNIEFLDIQRQKIDDELKAYTSSDPADKKKTFREQYQKKIQEQENLGKALREKQKTVREKHAPNMKQMKMWRDLQQIMECKQRCFDRRDESGGGLRYGGPPAATVLQEDMLVL